MYFTISGAETVTLKAQNIAEKRKPKHIKAVFADFSISSGLEYIVFSLVN